MENKRVPAYKELKSPITAQMALTYRCNNLCRYCYNSTRGSESQHNELFIKESRIIADQIINNEIFEVVLTGGEPLIRRDLLYPLADYFSSKNTDVKMNSNLVLVDKEDPQKIKDSGILSVFGSLSSYDEETYNCITQTENYQKAIKGLETLLEKGIPTGINMVVTDLNKNQVYETGRFLHNLGVNAFCATPASACKYMKQELELTTNSVVGVLDSLIALKEEFGMSVDVVEPIPRCIVDDSKKYEQFFRRDCAAGKMTISIDPNGDVTPCTHVSKTYGNLLERNLRDIWGEMKEWRDGSFVPERCYPCAEIDICSLGCREAGKTKKGFYNSPDPWSQNPSEKNRRISEVVSIDENQALKIPDKIKYRKEGEDYAVYCSNTHSVILVNKDFFDLIKTLYSRKDFTIKSLSEEWGDKSIVESTIKFLNTRGLIC
ncbi:MAG: radical SAM protein [Nanoarchaeota archaeon]|nr:radical SAM protein [Nanoarchaeota archaeon]